MFYFAFIRFQVNNSNIVIEFTVYKTTK